MPKYNSKPRHLLNCQGSTKNLGTLLSPRYNIKPRHTPNLNTNLGSYFHFRGANNIQLLRISFGSLFRLSLVPEQPNTRLGSLYRLSVVPHLIQQLLNPDSEVFTDSSRSLSIHPHRTPHSAAYQLNRLREVRDIRVTTTRLRSSSIPGSEIYSDSPWP